MKQKHPPQADGNPMRADGLRRVACEIRETREVMQGGIEWLKTQSAHALTSVATKRDLAAMEKRLTALIVATKEERQKLEEVLRQTEANREKLQAIGE